MKLKPVLILLITTLIAICFGLEWARLSRRDCETDPPPPTYAGLQAENAQLQAELDAAMDLIDAYWAHNFSLGQLLGQAAEALDNIVYGPYDRQEAEELIREVTDILRELNSMLTEGEAAEMGQALVLDALAADIDPCLLLAVMVTESGCRPGLRGASGEYGLLQVMPGTGAWVAGRLGYVDFEPTDMWDVRKNIQFGAFYLRAVTQGGGGDVAQGLLAYNRGPAGAKNWLAQRQAGENPYVYRVNSHYVKLAGKVKTARQREEAIQCLATCSRPAQTATIS